MRAVRLPALNAPLSDVEIDDAPPGPGEVQVRIEACGICHSDAHYRSGFGNIATPRTLGHEIAGVVADAGPQVTGIAAGDRVAIHYLLSCGTCRYCSNAGEQFCERGRMIGKHVDGGFAESIRVPARNAIPIPANVPIDVAAVMMCSTATAYHALQVAGFRSGKSVVILGLGGLGISAMQLSLALGASVVAAVDVVPEKLAGYRTVRAGDEFDIALDFTGRPDVIIDALRRLAPRGTLVLVALSEAAITFNPYRDVLGKERRIIGCSDHLREELMELMDLVATGKLKLDGAISRRVPLEAKAINEVLDELDRGTTALRSVVIPV
jgi:2-desacetyl-2-hydroxyethyl bacteriochlorophyllide A dehydrogenase